MKTKELELENKLDVKQISGSVAVIDALLAENTSTIFGYPGGAIMPIYDALYDFKDTLNNKEDITYCLTSGDYELIINYSDDSTIQDLGNINVINFNLPSKNINIKVCNAHYMIKDKIDYISFALCCRKLYNKYPNLKTVMTIPQHLNMQIVSKIIQKEFNNNLVKLIVYETTNTN